jgi:hypothetical protein
MVIEAPLVILVPHCFALVMRSWCTRSGFYMVGLFGG